MKLTKIFIVLVTLFIIGALLGPIDSPEISNMDGLGRSVATIVVIIIGVALWSAADREQKRR